MKITIVGNYLPKRCGIATFTFNLHRALNKAIEKNNLDFETSIFVPDDENAKFPESVTHVIKKNKVISYIEAAKKINNDGTSVCIIQHEFGIFGGEDGVQLLPFIYRLKVPLVVTMHTVLTDPSYTQRFIIEQLIAKAQRIIVMSKKAIAILREKYGLSKEKILLIEHGIPQIGVEGDKEYYRKKLGIKHKNVLFSFGLLSRNKGLETAIKALPGIIKKHPDTVYIIGGATHPNIVKTSGEEYREYLKSLAKELGVQDSVVFINRFFKEEVLFEYLRATDIFITPYHNLAQITSGALSYAVGAGCISVSTPYWHAEELLKNNRGMLFDVKDDKKLQSIISNLLSDPDLMNEIRNNCIEYSKKIEWPIIGEQYLDMMEYIFRFNEKEEEKEEDDGGILGSETVLPSLDFQHIYHMSDDVGMLQHASYCIPNRFDGYCIDDNARALMFALMAYKFEKSPKLLSLISTYMSFIAHLTKEDGNMRNFLGYDHSFLDEYGSEDSFGRTIWALGYVMKNPPNDAFNQMAKKIFYHSFQHFDNISSPRGATNVLIGISHYLDAVGEDEGMLNSLKKYAELLSSIFKKESSTDWKWFEDILTYDNGLLPLALLHAYEKTDNRKYLEIAAEAVKFLEEHTLFAGYLIPIGNRKWFEKGGVPSRFDQQPIDVMAMVLLYAKYYSITNEVSYLDKMLICYRWFLGENSLRLPLFDNETKGCCDGLESRGLNRNQGAESSLAYWISHLTVMFVDVDSLKTKKNQWKSMIL